MGDRIGQAADAAEDVAIAVDGYFHARGEITCRSGSNGLARVMALMQTN